MQGSAQTSTQENLAQQVQQLTDAMNRTQTQLEQTQRQMEEMRTQLTALRQKMTAAGMETAPAPPPEQPAEELAAQVDSLREQQAMLKSQVATQEQTKVESESKYPVKLSGLILLNGFANTKQVDIPSTPTLAIRGGGSTGASIRQTVLGLDARGPHLFGARSHADVRVDFDGTSQSGGGASNGTYYSDIGLLRLRTAHATLDWEHTQAFFSLDRPIISPNQPSSLTAIAIPALAWSGNLWSWNPQVGVTHDLPLSNSQRLRLQAALIDVSDAPVQYSASTAINTISVISQPSAAERSRWPGVETRIALLGTQKEDGAQLGFGGYFSPHRTISGTNFDAWAGTLDYRQPLPARLEFMGSFYRGQALGGLGGGGYKDYGYRPDLDEPGNFYFREFDAVGGWAQLKERFSERLEFNGAFGIDNVPATQLRPYADAYTSYYQNVARNRTFTGNVIYSPSAYLLFSLEYRRLETSPVNFPTAVSNIIGVAAGYKF
jgi:ribosomal protein L29